MPPKPPSALVKREVLPGLALPTLEPSHEDLWRAFITRRSPLTAKGYSEDMLAFARHAGLDVGTTPESHAQATAEVTRWLLRLPVGHANAAVLRYRQQMEADGRAPATINRRLAALRSFVKLGRVLGQVTWTLDVDGVKGERRRDVRGPEMKHVRELFAAAGRLGGAKGARATALLHLLFVQGFRSIEVRELVLSDLVLARGEVRIRGKGRREKRPVTLAPETAEALQAWLAVRPQQYGAPTAPVFPGHEGTLLTGAALHAIVSKLGKLAGIPRVWPHALRHSAATAALEATDGNLHAVQAFTRHARVDQLKAYDDERHDKGGEVAGVLGGLLRQGGAR